MSASRGRTAIATVLALGFALSLAAGTPASGQTRKKTTTVRRGAAAETVLVRIGTEVITPSVVQKRLDELPEQVRATFTSPEGRQRLLERMVEERVWLLASQKKGVQDRPEVKRQLDQQKRDLLIRTYVNEVMAGNPAPSDSESRAYYDAHTSEYQLPATVTLSHIQTKSESDAKKVVQWAKGGQDWKKLVEKYSTDTLTRTNGGVLGTATKEGVFGSIGAQPAIAEEGFKIGAGKIGGPIKTDKGWHVIKVDAVKEASTRPFEQVRGGIMRQLGSKRQQDFYNDKLQEARRNLGVHPDSAAIKAFVSQRKSARDLFNEAQAAGAPAARIEAYRQLLAEYPQSDVSPQARFMIGFIQSEELKDYDAADKSFRELLRLHPKSELAASAQWMVDHMRTEGAPEFMNLEGDSSAATTKKDEHRNDRAAGAKGTTDKP